MTESFFVIELAGKLNVALPFIALALLSKLVEDKDRSALRYSYQILAVLKPVILERAMVILEVCHHEDFWLKDPN